MTEPVSPPAVLSDVRVVPAAALHPNPWNPNVMDPRVYEAERESIRQHGFLDPVTVRDHPTVEGEWEIIDGEHRWKAAKDEGYSEVSILVLPPLSDAQAMRLTVILNETRGEADITQLGKLLAGLSKVMPPDELRQGLPYSDAELQHLIEVGTLDWSEFDRPPTEPPPPPLETHTVTLAYATAKEADRFHTLARIVDHERQTGGEPAAVLAALAGEVERIEAGNGGT